MVLSALVGLIYDAALDASLWPRALDEIRTYIGGVAANFFWQDIPSNRVIVHHSVNLDPRYTDLYIKKLAPLNPIFPAALFIEPGEIYSASDIIPLPEIMQTRFFEEWMRPQAIVDSVCSNLEKSSTSVAMLAVVRGEADGLVDQEARRRAGLIVPHVRRAASIGQLIEYQNAKAIGLSKALDSLAAGIFLLDASGRILFANSAGQRALDDRKVLYSVENNLVASEGSANQELQDALKSANEQTAQTSVRGTAIPLQSGQERWLAHVLPLNHGVRQSLGDAFASTVAVFVRKAGVSLPSPLEIVARQFKLTASEVRVLKGILDIGGVPEIADALGISNGTVRTHLKSIFAKTAVARQADLVKLVLGYASPSEG